MKDCGFTPQKVILCIRVLPGLRGHLKTTELSGRGQELWRKRCAGTVCLSNNNVCLQSCLSQPKNNVIDSIVS